MNFWGTCHIHCLTHEIAFLRYLNSEVETISIDYSLFSKGNKNEIVILVGFRHIKLDSCIISLVFLIVYILCLHDNVLYMQLVNHYE